jgi:hypothetical protein
MDVNKTSALLKRLERRGAIEIVEESPRKRTYQVSERLYNIYYLMRRNGREKSIIKALINFMTAFYQGDDLLNIIKDIAIEACDSPEDNRHEFFYLFQTFLEEKKNEIIFGFPRSFFELTDLPSDLKPASLEVKACQELFKRYLFKDYKGYEDYISKWLDLKPGNTKLISRRAENLYKNLHNARLANEILRKALESYPKDGYLLGSLGTLMLYLGKKDQGLNLLEKAISLGNPVHATELVKHYVETDPQNAINRFREVLPNDTVAADKTIDVVSFDFIQEKKKSNITLLKEIASLRFSRKGSRFSLALEALLAAEEGYYRLSTKKLASLLMLHKNSSGVWGFTIFMITILTAAGYGPTVLEIFSSHKDQSLKTLTNMIKFYLDKSSRIPSEMRQLAADVAVAIEIAKAKSKDTENSILEDEFLVFNMEIIYFQHIPNPLNNKLFL